MDLNALFEQAEQAYYANDYDKAIEIFTKIIAIDPKNAKAFNGRGVSHAALNNHQSSIADYDKTIELDPKYANAFYNRGVSKKALGDD